MTDQVLTSKNLPPQGAAVQVDPNDPYPNIKARPLQMPDFIDIKPVNPLIALRWCNRVAGEGQRLDQVTYAGFIPATPADVKYPNGKQLPASLIRDNKIIFGDLILMKIDRASYDGALKYNWERAVQRMHPNANKETGRNEISKVMKEAGVSTNALKGKLSVFQPSDAEIEAGEKASS